MTATPFSAGSKAVALGSGENTIRQEGDAHDDNSPVVGYPQDLPPSFSEAPMLAREVWPQLAKRLERLDQARTREETASETEFDPRYPRVGDIAVVLARLCPGCGRVLPAEGRCARCAKPQRSGSSRPELNCAAWQRKRAWVKRRDAGRCVGCGANSRLSVHHIVKPSDGGSDDSSNLVTLCSRCHAREHSRRLGPKIESIFLGAARPRPTPARRSFRHLCELSRN